MRFHILFSVVMICSPLSLLAQVGIGTEAPETDLHVVDTSETEVRITSENNISRLTLDAASVPRIDLVRDSVLKGRIDWSSNMLKLYSSPPDTIQSILGELLINNPTLLLSEGKNLGIGTVSNIAPVERLEVNGRIKLGYSADVATAGTMRFNSVQGAFEGYDGNAWSAFGGYWEKSGSTLRYNDGRVIIGRTNLTGAEYFGFRVPVNGPGYGGMYAETFGDPGGKPFYGYAVDGANKMWTFYDGENPAWKTYIGQQIRMTLLENGRLGIGTQEPITNMHVYGSHGESIPLNGIMAVGTDTHRLIFDMQATGTGAGTARIRAKGGAQKLMLGGGLLDVLTIDAVQAQVGIGTEDPNHTLEVISDDDLRALNVINTYSGYSTKIGANIEASETGYGTRYGLYAKAYANPNALPDATYAGRFLANNQGNDGNTYGIYSQVSGTGDGNHYGIYTYAATGDPGPDTKSWALYAAGNSYFQHNVHIGTFDGSPGFRLSVDGKILSEELKVQMSGDWPDYVFADNYSLMTLAETEEFIAQNKHLPGVPSASEVIEEGGIYTGEMHRILLEKVEELTLHIIEQDKRLKEYEEKLNEIIENH